MELLGFIAAVTAAITGVIGISDKLNNCITRLRLHHRRSINIEQYSDVCVFVIKHKNNLFPTNTGFDWYIYCTQHQNLYYQPDGVTRYFQPEDAEYIINKMIPEHTKPIICGK